MGLFETFGVAVTGKAVKAQVGRVHGGVGRNGSRVLVVRRGGGVLGIALVLGAFLVRRAFVLLGIRRLSGLLGCGVVSAFLLHGLLGCGVQSLTAASTLAAWASWHSAQSRSVDQT